VRELENCLHRAVLLAAGDEIGPEAITTVQGGPGARSQAPGAAGGTLALVGRTVGDVERDLILETLQHTLGNRTHAATILGISIRTLRNKLRQYGDEGIAVPPPSAGVAESAA
jgi:two-component system response regulator FlrC